MTRWRGKIGWQSVAIVLGLVVLSGFALRHVSGLYEPSPFQKAQQAYDLRKWGDAAEWVREELKLSKDDPAAQRLRARALARLGRDEPARAYFSKLDPASLEAEDTFLLGLLDMRRGQESSAIRRWEQTLASDPKHAETLEALVRGYTRQKRLEDALRMAEALALVPNWETQGDVMRGVLYVELNDIDSATQAFQQALNEKNAAKTTTSVSLSIHKLFVRCLLRTGKPAEAERQIRQILKQGPDAEASWLLSRSLLQQEKFAEAEAARKLGESYRTAHPTEVEPSPFVGEKSCVACHPGVFETCSASRHSRSFYSGPALLDLPRPEQPLTDPADASVSHAITRQGDQVQIETQNTKGVYRAVVEYAFGTPDRYLTMVARGEDGQFRASRFSSYHQGDKLGWDLSAGDTPMPDRDQPFLGRPMEVRAGVVRCLYCHTTNPRSGPFRVGPETADQGIGCERCHGPGATHIIAARAKFPDLAIANPGHGSASDITQNCADCHNLNPPEIAETASREDPSWVRSPGITLTWSRCYTESSGTLTCLTCHNPHQASAQISRQAYESKCVSCHQSSGNSGGRSVCSVNPRQGCLDCHMPAIPNPTLHTTLTDHYIRIRPKQQSDAAFPSPANGQPTKN